MKQNYDKEEDKIIKYFQFRQFFNDIPRENADEILMMGCFNIIIEELFKDLKKNTNCSNIKEFKETLTQFIKLPNKIISRNLTFAQLVLIGYILDNIIDKGDKNKWKMKKD